MREIPESVRAMIKRVCEQYPDNSKKAADEAERRLTKMKDYPLYADIMACRAVRDAVYDLLHNDNRKMKKAVRDWPGQDPKVVIGKSKAVQEAAAKVWNYHIAGTLLGKIVCKELPDIGDKELRIAAGYSFKGQLCHRLYKLVPKNKRDLTVSQAISEKRVHKIFEELQEGA